jgi:hypothetical protein
MSGKARRVRGEARRMSGKARRMSGEARRMPGSTSRVCGRDFVACENDLPRSHRVVLAPEDGGGGRLEKNVRRLRGNVAPRD